jgi:DNA invertase Pin-like site-specific DNA recombinase
MTVRRIDKFFIPSNNLRPKRVAAYCRVSTLHEEQKSSLEAQIHYYQAFIDSQPDWTLAGIYAEQKSARGGKRSQFHEMLEDCRAGKIDLIYTKSISRFSRDTVHMLTVTQELKALNIDVFSKWRTFI